MLGFRTTRSLVLTAVSLTVLSAIVLPLAAPGCRQQEPAPARPRSSVPVKSYTVRGEIEALPAAARPGTQFIVRHEEIPDFVRQDGSLGMKPMAMPFPLGPNVSLEGLAVGDAVTLDFTVDWNGDPTYWVTSVRKETAGAGN